MATAIFRVSKNSNFTIVSNYHLQDKNLSLKAKGLLTLILSLPDDWDMTLKGLVSLSSDGVDATRSTLNELEKNGYLRRFRSRNELGQLLVTEYTVYEVPDLQNEDENGSKTTQIGKSDMAENTQVGKSDVDINSTHIGKSDVDNVTQIGLSNIGKSIYGKSNPTKYYNEQSTNNINNSINQSDVTLSDNKPCKVIDKMDRAKELLAERKFYEDLIKENISYDVLSCSLPSDFLDLCVSVMVDAITSSNTVLKIKGQEIPQEAVKSRLLKLTDENIEYLDFCLSNSKASIKNIQSYMLTALYCASFGADTYFGQLFKADLKEKYG